MAVGVQGPGGGAAAPPLQLGSTGSWLLNAPQAPLLHHRGSNANQTIS